MGTVTRVGHFRDMANPYYRALKFLNGIKEDYGRFRIGTGTFHSKGTNASYIAPSTANLSQNSQLPTFHLSHEDGIGISSFGLILKPGAWQIISDDAFNFRENTKARSPISKEEMKGIAGKVDTYEEFIAGFERILLAHYPTDAELVKAMMSRYKRGGERDFHTGVAFQADLAPA